MALTLMLLLSLLPSDDDKSGQAGIAVSVGRKDSAARVLVEDGAAVLDVTSEFGIDRATVERRGDDWPKKIVVRLHLGGLESFRVTAGETTVEWSAAVDGKARASLFVGDKETAVENDSPYFTQVRVDGGDGKTPLKDGYFEVPLPAKMFEKNPDRITLRWIDFFRG